MAATKSDKLNGNNLYVVLMLVSLLVVGASALIVKTLIGSIALDTKVVSAKRLAKKQLTSDLSAAPQLVDAYNALGPQAQVLSDALPSTSDFEDLIVTLENMTNTAGLQLKSVTPTAVASATTTTPAAGASSGSSSPQPFPFSITFAGDYTGLQKLLTQLETSARPMRVVGLQVSGSGSSLSGEVDIQTYYQAQATLPFSEETVK